MLHLIWKMIFANEVFKKKLLLWLLMHTSNLILYIIYDDDSQTLNWVVNKFRCWYDLYPSIVGYLRRSFFSFSISLSLPSFPSHSPLFSSCFIHLTDKVRFLLNKVEDERAFWMKPGSCSLAFVSPQLLSYLHQRRPFFSLKLCCQTYLVPPLSH